MNIGERIAFFRAAKGLTVNRLATLSGISQSYLRDIEIGKNHNPTIELLECLCDTLGISLKDFFDTDSTNKIQDDPLIHEIYQLNPEQRKNLEAFLKSMRSL